MWRWNVLAWVVEAVDGERGSTGVLGEEVVTASMHVMSCGSGGLHHSARVRLTQHRARPHTAPLSVRRRCSG